MRANDALKSTHAAPPSEAAASAQKAQKARKAHKDIMSTAARLNKYENYAKLLARRSGRPPVEVGVRRVVVAKRYKGFCKPEAAR